MINKLTQSADNAVGLLVVGIASVPGKLVLEIRLSLECLLKQQALNADTQMDNDQTMRQLIRCQLHEHCGHIASTATAVVHEIEL